MDCATYVVAMDNLPQGPTLAQGQSLGLVSHLISDRGTCLDAQPLILLHMVLSMLCLIRFLLYKLKMIMVCGIILFREMLLVVLRSLILLF